MTGIPKSAERLRIEQELLDKGWVIVTGQPARTVQAARSLIYVAGYSVEIPQSEVITEARGNQVLGYDPNNCQ